MYKLTDLRARFIRYERTPEGQVTHRKVDSIEDAQGVMFLCPKCWRDNNGPVGTHMVICWDGARGVPEDAFPHPGRWKLVGTCIDDLTLEAHPPKTRSVLLTAGCKWHGFLTNGMADIC